MPLALVRTLGNGLFTTTSPNCCVWLNHSVVSVEILSFNCACMAIATTAIITVNPILSVFIFVVVFLFYFLHCNVLALKLFQFLQTTLYLSDLLGMTA